MLETPDTFADEYNAFLQSASGFNRRIAESGQLGQPGEPRAIVEINGDGRRTFPRDVLARRHLVTVNIGKCVDGFDRTIPVDDIHQAPIEKLLCDVPVSSVIIAHQEEWLDENKLSEVLLDALARLDGGSAYCVGEVRWDGKYEAIRDAIILAKEACGSVIQASRELLLPMLTIPFAKTIATKNSREQIAAIMTAVREGSGDAMIKTLPLDLSLQTAYKPRDAYALDNKFAIPKMADEVITVTKLTEQQRSAMRRRQRLEKERKRRK